MNKLRFIAPAAILLAIFLFIGAGIAFAGGGPGAVTSLSVTVSSKEPITITPAFNTSNSVTLDPGQTFQGNYDIRNNSTAIDYVVEVHAIATGSSAAVVTIQGLSGDQFAISANGLRTAIRAGMVSSVQVKASYSKDAPSGETAQVALIVSRTACNTVSCSAPTPATCPQDANITLMKSADSPNGDVILNAKGVSLAKYQLRADGCPIQIKNLVVTVDSSNNSVGRLRNGAIFANGVQIGSTADLYETDSATVSTQYDFTSFVVVPNSPVTLDVRSDVYDNFGNNLTPGDTLQVTLKTGSNNAFVPGSNLTFNAPVSNVAGNAITASQGSLALTKYSGFANPFYVIPQTNIKMAHFVISAGSTEDVDINAVSFDYVYGTASNIRDVYAVLGGDTLPTKITIQSTNNTWAVNKVLPAGQSIDLVVYGSIAYEAAVGIISANVAGTTSISGKAVYGAQNNTIVGRTKGQVITFTTPSFTVAKDGSTPLNGIVAASQQVTAAAFRYSAQYGSCTIQELRYRIPAKSSNAITNATLMSGNTAIQTNTFTISDANQNDTVAFTKLNIQMPANTSLVLTVNLELADVRGTNSAASGTPLQLTQTYMRYTCEGGWLTTDTITNPQSNTLFVYEGYPTFTADNTLPNTFVNGAETVLYQWKEKANGGSVAIKQVPFQVVFASANSSALRVDQFKLLKNGVDITDNVTMRNEQGESVESTLHSVSNTGSPAVMYITWDNGNEDQIAAGQEVTYQLVGVPSGFKTTAANGADAVSFQLASSADASLIARKFLAQGSNGICALGNVSGQSSGTAAGLVWSDLSGGDSGNATTPHNSSSFALGTSDWDNGYLIFALPLQAKGWTSQ